MRKEFAEKCRILAVAGIIASGILTGCGKAQESETGRETVELVWYQLGETQKDADLVLRKVNEYTVDKLGVSL